MILAATIPAWRTATCANIGNVPAVSPRAKALSSPETLPNPSVLSLPLVEIDVITLVEPSFPIKSSGIDLTPAAQMIVDVGMLEGTSPSTESESVCEVIPVTLALRRMSTPFVLIWSSTDLRKDG